MGLQYIATIFRETGAMSHGLAFDGIDNRLTANDVDGDANGLYACACEMPHIRFSDLPGVASIHYIWSRCHLPFLTLSHSANDRPNERTKKIWKFMWKCVALNLRFVRTLSVAGKTTKNQKKKTREFDECKTNRNRNDTNFGCRFHSESTWIRP